MWCLFEQQRQANLHFSSIYMSSGYHKMEKVISENSVTSSAGEVLIDKATRTYFV